MDLVGWDVVFAIDVDTVNEALAERAQGFVQNFNLSDPLVLSGSYGNWRIAPGGSGSIVLLAITITSGTLQTASEAKSIAGAIMTLKVALELLPADANTRQLQFDFSRGGITFVRLEGGAGLTEIEAAEVGTALAQDLSAHMDKVQFVLASVSPLGPGGPTWLNPAQLAFGYVLPEGGRPTLAIFATVTTRNISNLDRRVDPQLVSSGNIGLAISPGLFMQHVLAPALAAALRIDPSRVVLRSPTTLGNRGDIGLPGVSEAGERYYPSLQSLSAQLIDDRVHVNLSGRCDMHMGISMSFSARSAIGLSLDRDGKLAFSTLGAPDFSKDVDVPWYDHLLDIVTVVAEAILDATVSAISSELASGISHVTGTSDIAAQAPAIVKWVGEKGFTPNAAGLADCLWLRAGTPRPAVPVSPYWSGALSEHDKHW